MSNWGGWRPHIESARCLDLRRMFELGALRVGSDTVNSWVWQREGETVSSLGYHATLGEESGLLTLNYSTSTDEERKQITCTIRLVTLPRHYGGRIWYFVCPYSGKRARKLYKWAQIDWFCHRTAVTPKPTYACQRVGGSDRITAQRWALRRRMGDEYSDLFDEPRKPKWMRWKTYERHAARDAELAERDLEKLGQILRRWNRAVGGDRQL